MHPDVRQLLTQIAPGEHVTELGGTMSLNLHLHPSHRVLRVHQPFVTASRLLGEQALRRHVAQSGEGLLTAEPVSIHGRTVLRCGKRLGEVEPFLDSIKPEASVTSYRWLFVQLGRFHRSVLDADMVLPRSLAATWAPPGSLARWLKVTVPVLSVTSEGSQVAHRLSVLTSRVRRMWIPPASLPAQVVHGDFRLGNLTRSPMGLPVVFDFGFADRRPRVHDLAYSLAFMVLALGTSNVSPLMVADLIHHYSEGRGQELDQKERQALPAYAASVMLHATAHDGFTALPLASLEHRRPFLDVADWLLDTDGA
jgi:Ser/Thr protein kinase RdoA (MazF antagonist)